MLRSHLLKSYKTHEFGIKNRQVWIACSGGRDSMALAHLINKLYLENRISFQPKLIHVHHGMQKANDDWASFVIDWADKQNIRSYLLHADLEPEQYHNELSARNARYAAMMSLMADGDVLMLAHHANDQTETMLMRLLQGSGVKGLAGMKMWTSKLAFTESTDKKNRQASDNTTHKYIYLWRPLLLASRKQITDYVNSINADEIGEEHKLLPYVDDPTNLEGDNLRSWMRTELLPVVSDKYPSVVQAISRSTQLLEDADSILTEVFTADLAECYCDNLSITEACEVLDIRKIKELSSARQSQLIHRWIQGCETVPPSQHRVLEVSALVARDDNDQQSQLYWQGTEYSYCIRRYRGFLYRLRSDWLIEVADISKNSELTNQKILRVFNTYTEQKLLTINNNQLRLLTKNDKILLRKNTKAKAGKKLLQELEIPSWERSALWVVESISSEKDNRSHNVYLALISPRFIWFLAGSGVDTLKKIKHSGFC